MHIGIGVLAVLDLAAGLEHFVLVNSAKGSADEHRPVIRESADAAEIWFQRPASSSTFKFNCTAGALAAIAQPAIAPALVPPLPRPPGEERDPKQSDKRRSQDHGNRQFHW